MGPNLTSFGGVIAPGNYGILTLNGSHTLEHGVCFATLILRGSARLRHCAGGRIVCDSGSLNCDGPIRVDSVSGAGHLHTRGDLHCMLMDFTGVFDGTGDVLCDTDLRFVGALVGERSITAGRLNASGVFDARAVKADDITIEPFDSGLFARHGITHFSRVSEIRDITGSKVEITRVRCQRIRAATVIIGEHCDVDHVIYRDECRLSPSSQATHIGREWPDYRWARRRA